MNFYRQKAFIPDRSSLNIPEYHSRFHYHGTTERYSGQRPQCILYTSSNSQEGRGRGRIDLKHFLNCDEFLWANRFGPRPMIISFAPRVWITNVSGECPCGFSLRIWKWEFAVRARRGDRAGRAGKRDHRLLGQNCVYVAPFRLFNIIPTSALNSKAWFGLEGESSEKVTDLDQVFRRRRCFFGDC
jgi:hypothetical protein